MSDREVPAEALVVFQPSGRRGRFPHGTPVLDAARTLGVYLESVCGGRGLCGRCQIDVETGQFAKYGIASAHDHLTPEAALETRYRTRKPLAEDRRLGCSALIAGDLVVSIPSEAQVNRQVVRKGADGRHIPRDLATRLCYAELDAPDMSVASGDADRLIEVIERDWGYAGLSLDPALLKSVQSMLRAGDWKVTAGIFQELETHPVVTGLWPGLKETIYGLAVDIGSTTIAAHLCDLMSGQVISTAGALNPQIRFGEDLMSRVSYIQMNPDSRPALTGAVRDAIRELIGTVAGDAEIDPNDIVEAVFVGNPIMHHLFLGIDPTELGGAPFPLAVSSALTLPAHLVEIGLVPSARVHVLPCIAGHVGADAAAMTLSERPYEAEETTLLVDIGTNAEIVLGNREKVLAASSPTGPAFEGAEISCGQRAAPGAIERVRIDPATRAVRFKVIGADIWSDEAGFAEQTAECGVTGICGSGIVEAIAEMFLSGVVSVDGVIEPPTDPADDKLIKDGRTYAFVIHRGAIEISISQKDVRAIQLAKAALYAGARLLMDKLGVDHVQRVKLAGAFGSFIDPKYAMVLGLIPDCDLAQVGSVGNAASTGARMALLNRTYRREIQIEVRKLIKIETAIEPRFQEHFVNAMAFPNKVEPFSQLRAQVTLPAAVAATTTGRRSGGRRARRS